jgi:hypothetical protein
MKAYASGIILAIALAACNGATTPSSAGLPAPPRPSTLAAISALPSHPDRRPSWISPQVKSATQLLFVSDAGTDDVYMYKLPALKLVGTITGFVQPQGECADNKGDVWITDTNAQTIYEVNHQGRLVNSLSDASGYPDGCAWDPKSGALAVMNLFDLNGAKGGIVVYPSSSKLPTLYTNPNQYYYSFGGYDASSNLFFDGHSQDGAFMLSELPNGAKSAHTITISGGRIYFPGMVQWLTSSNKLLVGDQDCKDQSAACVYHLATTASSAKIVGSTRLETSAGGQICDLVQGVEANGELMGSDDNFCGPKPSGTGVWAYPTGGKPQAYNDNGAVTPVGAALSSGRGVEQGLERSGTSWMDSSLSRDDLVYVSDADGEVTVNSYRTGDLVGVLADFEHPAGECSDGAGNVYVTDATRQKIYEYAHGGTKSIKTLNDSPYTPNGCSVDPLTGNLAVANLQGKSSPGNIAVYTDATGKPALHTDASISSFEACAYNNQGILLATGTQTSNFPSTFAWLRRRDDQLVNVEIPGPSPSWRWEVSGIQWDGMFFVLDEPEDAFQIALMNGQAYYVGETAVAGGGQYAIYDPNPARQGTQILVGYAGTASSTGGVYYFPYPASGQSDNHFTHGVYKPFDVVVSLKK